MSKRSAELLLKDILSSCEKIIKYTEGMTFEQFISNDMTIDATIRNFEIIGEASNRLPEEIKDRYTNID